MAADPDRLHGNEYYPVGFSQASILMGASARPYRLYLQLVAKIEDCFQVQRWRSGDIDLWPLVSQDLFLDIFRMCGGDTAPAPPSYLLRAVSGAALPVINLWKSRADFAHLAVHPRRSDTILLGDGVSLDFVDGAWRDRYCEPVASALEKMGRTCFFMQSGNLNRLPWARPTFPANQVASRAAFKAALAKFPQIELPDHERVIRLLEEKGVHPFSLAKKKLARRARTVAAQASCFDRILEEVQPRTAYVVSYYAGLGHAFALACRRRGIICIDLQHCPHGHMARGYRWSVIPAQGYSTVPALFWAWTRADAAQIRRWTDTLDQDWHRAIAGGHTQIDALSTSEIERLWQMALAEIGDDREFDREILVTLQPIGGKRAIWEALKQEINASPASWRWWIRRHPASTSHQDSEYAALLSMGRAGIVVGQASQIPLPVLLAHMDAQVSLASGSAGEAAMLGVPAFFLDAEARDTFPELLARGEARIIAIEALVQAIDALRPRPGPGMAKSHDLEQTLGKIDRLAAAYSRLCSKTTDDQIDRSVGIVRQAQLPHAR